MTAGDRAVDGAAEKFERAADRAAAEGGLKARLAGELNEDAAFLRKMKPSLIAARIRGERPAAEPPVRAERGPVEGVRGNREVPPTSRQAPNPLVVAAAAFAVGLLIAKVVDWRAHAHPRD